MRTRLFTRILPIALFLSVTTALSAQVDISRNWNLDFEQGSSMATDWSDMWHKGEYKVYRDGSTASSGNFCTVVESNGEPGFACIITRVAAPQGQSITVSADLALTDVEGAAGIIVRVDGDGETLSFTNMLDEGIDGTFDWTRYTATLPIPAGARNIYFGGIMRGEGTARFDNFTVEIDGTDLRKVDIGGVSIIEDHEFDEGSDIDFATLSQIQTNNLSTLCKVWGFLKYYHPAAASGSVQWDYELFRVMPDILASDSREEANTTLANWIYAIPIPSIEEEAPAPEQTEKLAAPIEWISNIELLGSDLSTALESVKAMPKSNRHYYLAFFPGVGNADLSRELSYSNIDISDDGYRMLALFRYWNIIEYLFPYRHLMDEDWDDILDEFIPALASGDSDEAYTVTMTRLIGKIQDTHANVWGGNKTLASVKGLRNIPVRLNYVEDHFVVVETHDDYPNNLRAGDIILAINGKSVQQRVEYLTPISPASNRPTQMRDISRTLLRTNAESLRLSIDRDGNKIEIDVPTLDYRSYSRPGSTPEAYSIIDNNISYLYPGSLKNGEIEEIIKKIKKTKGLIIDFRSYPSDFIVFSLGEFLMPKSTPFVKFTSTNLHAPGQFTTSDPLPVGRRNSKFYNKPIVIIINETTQSSAEYHTMAFRQAPNATVLGSTTAAADGNVSRFTLPGGITTMISGIGVYTPEGDETQRVGIIPDEEMHPTLDGIRQGRDELLERAIEIINNNK